MFRKVVSFTEDILFKEQVKHFKSLEIDAIAERLMYYSPNQLKTERRLSQSEVLDTFDQEFYNFEDGHWRSKVFPNLILGTFDDIRSNGKSPAILANDVVIRFRSATGKSVSFYFFGDHGSSVKYAMEAVVRGEMPATGNTHMFMDEHHDESPVAEKDGTIVKPGRKPLKQNTFPTIGDPKSLSLWEKLTVSIDNPYYGISMKDFNDAFSATRFFDRHFWIKGDSGLWQTTMTKTMEGSTGWQYIGKYFEACEKRPKNNRLYFNLDTDATGMQSTYSKYPELTIDKLLPFSDFLIQISREDGNTASTFQAATSHYISRDIPFSYMLSEEEQKNGKIYAYGSVVILRFLARVAPVILLTSNKDISTERLSAQIREVAEQEIQKNAAIN